MIQKTFDRQTAKFLAKIAECMPILTGEDMQSLINNPMLLKQKLYDGLVPAQKNVINADTEENNWFLNEPFPGRHHINDTLARCLRTAGINSPREVLTLSPQALNKFKRGCVYNNRDFNDFVELFLKENITLPV